MSTSQGVWLIRGARPLGGSPADVVIRDGVIDSVGDGPAPPGARVHHDGVLRQLRHPGAI